MSDHFAQSIKPHTPIICAEGHHHGVVDHLDGSYIKIAKDDQGNHHWLPLTAIDHVDEHVHLNLNHQQVKEQWLSEEPAAK